MIAFSFKKTTLILFVAMLICSKLFSQSVVVVGGEVAISQEWTNDHFYVINSDLGIPSGVTLTIHPGVKIYINPNVGITCDGGKIIANGKENGVVDSIIFLQAFLKQKDGQNYWKSISVSNVSDTTSFYMNYVRIEGAESGLDFTNCKNIKVCNSLIRHNYINGINMTNVINSTFENNIFYDNYNGIQICANEGDVANNQIVNNKFIDGRQNIRAYTRSNGRLINNYITNNYFTNANTAIYIQDITSSATFKNWICNNVISSTGTSSSGLWGYADSLQIENNIFWNNERALRFTNSFGSMVSNNTFYKNDSCLWTVGNLWNADFSNNTFSENKFRIMRIPHSDYNIENNNFLHNETKPLIYNSGAQTLDVKNNFWGITNDSILNADYFWDSDNDETLGEIVFSPFLDSCNINAPLAPPYNVKKQLIGDKIKLSWNKNPESDVKSYKIYSGDFKYYNFSNFVDFSSDTVVFIESSFSNIFGVTAVDSISDSTKFNHEFESAFAIAQPYPYAGNNDTLCENEIEYVIETATVPFLNDGSNWTTSGTGYFEDSHSILTTYYPSEEDFENKSVTLSLNVTTINGTFTDDLQIVLLQAPVVFAGNDSIVDINQNIRIVESYVENQSSVLWQTLGDGHFNDSTLVHPEYVLGEADVENGFVSLVIKAISKCGESYDTVSFTLLPTYSLSGKIWRGDLPYSNAQVIAVNVETENLYYLDRTQSNDEGFFVFENLFEGIYSVLALPDTIGAKTAFGYYADRQHWQDSHHITLSGNTYDVDIQLTPQPVELINGEGKISGIFELPTTDFRETKTFCSDWFDRNSECTYCNGGLSNIALSLYNSNGAIFLAYTLTNNEGHFCFDSLPYGNYFVTAELSGYENVNTQAVSILPENQFVDDIVFRIMTDKILFYRETDNEISDFDYTAFPNPATNKIYLVTNNDEINVIRIANVIGNEVIAISKNNIVVKNNAIEIDVRSLTSGIYFITIFDQKGVHTLKFIKN